MTDAVDVVIIGAGPTGLMAALLLHESGVKFRILDKNSQPARESRAFVLQARSLELLLNLGIVHKFLAQGSITPGVKIFVNGKQAALLLLDDIGAEDTPYSFVFMLPQSEIEALLSKELKKRGIVIERNMEVRSLTQTTAQVTVTVSDKKQQLQTIQARYLIGADGAHSAVRENLKLEFIGAAYQQNFILADCTVEWPLDYEFLKIFMRGRSFGIFFPMRGEKISRVVAINPSATSPTLGAAAQATTAEPLGLPEVEKAFQTATGVPVKLSNPVWVSRYRIHHRSTNRYAEGRVFLAGDAAHIHSPVGGQGMNTGLQDAANLAWKLAVALNNPAATAVLETYDAERWPIGQKLLHFTDNLFSKISSQKKWQTALRNFLIPLIIKTVSRIPNCRHHLFRFISQLGVRYHQNAFLKNDLVTGKRSFLTAGQRAPNGLIQRNLDVFSLIKGYQFHVLVFSKKALSLDEITKISAELASLPDNLGLPLQKHFITHSLVGMNPAIIQVENNEVFEKYGLNYLNACGLFLIRPDGYIAYQSNVIDIQKLQNFCGVFL